MGDICASATSEMKWGDDRSDATWHWIMVVRGIELVVHQ